MTYKKRLTDIDKAKGLAIFLVVLGHIVATDIPYHNEWYATLKMLLYKFHMPFFMYISGLIMAYTYHGTNSISDYKSYVMKKFIRLAPAFFIFGLITYFGKLFASQFMHVDNIPGDPFTEIYDLLLLPSQSAGGSLWFIYVLMEMYIIFPVIIVILRKSPVIGFILALILHFVPVTNYFLIDRVFEYFIFICLGVYAVLNYEYYLRLIDEYIILFISAFIASLYVISYLPNSESKLVIGVLSIPALHGIVRTTFFSKAKIWSYYGNYSYSIYLMNTIIIGITKGVILIFTSWHGVNFLWIAPVLLIAGLYGPIFLKKIIISRLPVLDRITT